MEKLITLCISGLIACCIFSACQKENNETSTIKDSCGTKITEQLVNFKESLTLKSDQKVSLDSAVWYIEGILNYERANNTHEFASQKFIRDTINDFSLNEYLISKEILKLYSCIDNVITKSLSQKENYCIDFIDLNLQRPLNNDGIIIVTYAMGEKSTIPSLKPPFGPTDYWQPGGYIGKCGEYQGQCYGRDATTELASKFNSVLTSPGYYTSLTNEFADPFMFETNDNPFGGYMMWTSSNSNYCICPDELNYYFSKFNFIVASLKPTGKSFKSVEVIHTYIVGKSTALHMYDIYYGVKIENPN